MIKVFRVENTRSKTTDSCWFDRVNAIKRISELEDLHNIKGYWSIDTLSINDSDDYMLQRELPFQKKKRKDLENPDKESYPIG